jgi:hypothetical protein
MLSLLSTPFLLATMAISTPPPCARACTCLIADLPLTEAVQVAVQFAKAVFSGRVLRIEPTPEVERRLEPWDEIRVRIIVDERWKGTLGDTVVVRASSHSSMCGADLQEGERYVVYADTTDAGALFTSRCHRTAPLGRVSRKELRLLRKIRSTGDV